MPIKLLVAADDFTGALDTAVQFSKQGASVWVATEKALQALPEGTEVLSVDLETRHLPREEAFSRTLDFFQRVRQAGPPQLPIYKKTDSAMRGNVGAELAALSSAYGGAPILFFPAFPAMGRTVRDGILRINGVPVAETAFARDPLNPIRQSDIREILAAQGMTRVESVPIGSEALRESAVVHVFDGETESDLWEAGRRFFANGCPQLSAGNAGFAGVLAAQFAWRHASSPLRTRRGAILLLCGSLHEASAAQTAYAEQALGFQLEPLPAGLPEKANCWETPTGREVLRRLSQILQDGRNTVVRTQCAGAVASQAAQAVSKNLGALCRVLLQTGAVGTLVIFGGDTLLGVMEALSCHRLRPVCEVAPGVVASNLDSGFDGCVITKAGAFGTASLPGEILSFLAVYGEPGCTKTADEKIKQQDN